MLILCTKWWRCVFFMMMEVKWPFWRCHQGEEGCDTWSLYRRSSPLCSRLRAGPENQDLGQASTALAQSSQKGSPHAGSVICNWSTIARTGSPAHIYDSSQADSGAASIHANTEGQGAGDRETELVTSPSVGDTCTSLSPPPWNTKYPSTPKPKKYFQLADLTSSMW